MKLLTSAVFFLLTLPAFNPAYPKVNENSDFGVTSEYNSTTLYNTSKGKYNRPDRRIDIERFITIGGADQWVTIKGEDKTKPIVLSLHDGPGSPLSPFSDTIYGEWEKNFVLVQKNQRGAGRTYGRNSPSILTQNTYTKKQTINTIDGSGTISFSEIDEFLRVQMDSLKIPGLSIAIIEDDEIVYSKNLGYKNLENKKFVDGNTLFEAASLTKPVFAYTVVKLAEKGILDLDTPLYKYYPYYEIDYDERYKQITARMVLAHTSGLPNWRHGSFNELTIDFEPGSQFGYSGEGYYYLSLVVKHLTGKKLHDLVKEEVFEPMGMENSYLIWNNYLAKNKATGYKDRKPVEGIKPNRTHVAGTMHSNANDYAKFILTLMRELDDSNSVFQKMTVPQISIPTPPEMGLPPDTKVNSCMGLISWENSYGIKFIHDGNNNNIFMSNFQLYKEPRIGYVYFMNCGKGDEFKERLNSFLEIN